ncbi:MAG: transglycosylase SLT domain-containing protein, partial [Bacteroidota bacterium]|nr:transglycosylase SLT domain-containing protein [Bacteroidota bacterium]
MKNIYIIFLIICLFANSAIANKTDSLSVVNLENSYENNLDSLIDLWYVKNIIKTEYPDSIIVNNDIADVSDSVYIERLSEIPSVIDLTYNKIVRNYIHVYIKKRRTNVQYMLGMSDYYFPIFERTFEKYGLPTELKYMAVIESALNPRAVSRVGATGLWQFMYGTARMYDLTINSYVDERRDPIKSTDAAARFLSDLHDMFDDWTLAIAAYNCGPGNVRKAIRRAGGNRNFWDIYYFLPRETRGYVPAFIAAYYSMTYFEEHNLYYQRPEISIATDTLIVNDNLHLKQVSEVLNIPYKQLRDLNPQYKLSILPAKGKQQALILPTTDISNFIDLQDSIFSYKDSIYFNKDNSIKSPHKSHYVYQPPSNKTKVYYTIKPGDNLGFISEWFNVGLSNLKYWNRIRGSRIRSGQRLVIYVSKNKVSYYKKINSMSFEQKQRSIGKSVHRSIASLSNNNADGDYVYYKVKTGDTLWDIAKLYPGVSDYDILRLN